MQANGFDAQITMTVPKTFKLNTGADIPTIGLGTWQSSPGKVATAVEQALKLGYRHIDAAFCYQNEDEVGRGLQTAFRSGIKREDVFITSKLWNTYHRKVEEGLNASLKALRVDYLDLYLMHWPVPMNPAGNHPLFPTREDGSRDLDSQWSFVETWKELEKLIKTGKVKAEQPDANGCCGPTSCCDPSRPESSSQTVEPLRPEIEVNVPIVMAQDYQELNGYVADAD